MLVDLDPDPYVVALDYSTFVNIVLTLSLWVLYSILFAYTITKWKVLRCRPELLGATILLYIIYTAQALLYLPTLARQFNRFEGITDLSKSWVLGEFAAIGIFNALGNMMGDLTLVYRLWIVAGDSKFRYWIVVPVATAVVGAGFGIFNSVSIFFETSYNLIDASSLLAVFLPLCTNFMATAGLSYRIYKETRHESAPSMQNKARLRLIAMGLIETGFLYFAIQLSNCVISAIALDRSIRGIFPLPVDILWALAVLGALNAMTPGIAMTLITAKINITGAIGSRQDLIKEVFAPWRPRSVSSDIPEHYATLSCFRAATSLPSYTGITASSKQSFVSDQRQGMSEKLIIP